MVTACSEPYLTNFMVTKTSIVSFERKQLATYELIHSNSSPGSFQDLAARESFVAQPTELPKPRCHGEPHSSTLCRQKKPIRLPKPLTNSTLTACVKMVNGLVNMRCRPWPMQCTSTSSYTPKKSGSASRSTNPSWSAMFGTLSPRL